MKNSTSIARAELQKELAKEFPDYKAISILSAKLLDENQDEVRFSVDAQHISKLGLELVGKQETALSELIKNAFDADATEVEITFKDHNKPGGQVILSDDGVGMDIDTVKSSWMRLSTNQKVNNPRSTLFRRLRAGKKGIGRFAVQRIGKKLILETAVQGASEGIRVHFDWDTQFKAGEDLGAIWNKIETYKKDKNNHGTKLIISDVRDKWPAGVIEKVWKSVLLLQPPYKVSKSRKSTTDHDPGFVVVINGVTSKQHEKEVSIKTEFLDHAIATIVGEIDDRGVATFTLTSEKLKSDDGKSLKETQEASSKFLVTGKVHFEARYFIYEADAMASMSVKDASRMGRLYGGVRLYRDGFRVLPYGEPQDDWLKLAFDTARRNILVPANNNNFFGHVEITEVENSLLEETSGREGLIENEAFDELRTFVRDGLEWATKRVAASRKRKETASQKNFKSEFRSAERPLAEEIIDILKNKTTEFTEKGKEDKQRQTINLVAQKIQSFERAIEQIREDGLKYEAMLRILASLGLSVSIFSHEISGAHDMANTSLALLRKQLGNIQPPPVRKTVGDKLGAIHTSINKVFDLGSYLSEMMSSTESRALKTVSVRGALQNFVKQFKEYMSKYNVKFELSDVDPPGLRTCKVHRSEIDSVLFNFLTNSLKALDVSNQKNRRIKISAFEEKKNVVIRFEDNGHGVPENIRDKIFDAFYTTSSSHKDQAAGAGTGLGLKIVSDIATSYGGKVGLEKPSSGFKCCFEFRIPSAQGETQS